MRRWESNQTKKKEAMVARARARDAKRHERREQTAVDRSRKLAASLSESNATNEALRSMVREITQKHVAALAALGVAEEKAETALLSAQKLKPARAFSEDEEPEPEPESPEPTTPQLRFAKARSDARDDLHAARVAAEAARATRNADREALAAARKKLWALVGVLADADAELEASQRNPDGASRCLSFYGVDEARRWRTSSSGRATLTTPRAGLGVDELTKRVDEARAASADADEKLAAADTEDDNQSLVDACRDARRALDESVAALDAAVRVARTGKAGEDATPRRLEREPAKAYRVRVGCGVPLTRLRGSRRWRKGASIRTVPRRSGELWRPRRPPRRRAARARARRPWPSGGPRPRRRRSSSAWTPSTTSAAGRRRAHRRRRRSRHRA